jgi:tellurite resistance-related uncharacterized protein
MKTRILTALIALTTLTTCARQEQEHFFVYVFTIDACYFQFSIYTQDGAPVAIKEYNCENEPVFCKIEIPALGKYRYSILTPAGEGIQDDIFEANSNPTYLLFNL